MGEEGGHRGAGAGGARGAWLQGGGGWGPGAQGEGGPRLALQGFHLHGAGGTTPFQPDQAGEEQAEVVVLHGVGGRKGVTRLPTSWSILA